MQNISRPMNITKVGEIMSFSYNKLFALLKERGITSYKIRRENIVSQAALTKMKSGEGNIDTRTLERLCAYLNCQPGDIMEYVEDDTRTSVTNSDCGGIKPDQNL